MNLDFPAIRTALKSFLQMSFFLWFACTVAAQATSWNTFRSEKGHFSVKYPADWNLFDERSGIFEIINFPHSQMLKGVGLSKRGASIIVVAGPPGVNKLEGWVADEGAFSQKRDA